MTNENVLSEQIKDSLEEELHATAAEADVSYLNVMQALVEDKADKYMKSANMCMCPRCRIDVIALTLSKLPSKYVVLQQSDTVPMLSVYENRYSANILAQMMSACEMVKAHSRHDKDGEKPRGVAFVR